MAIVETIIDSLWKFAIRHFGALQVCWLCLVAVMGLGWFVTTNFALASEQERQGLELAQLKADSIAKRIFDYRVRQCDTPPEQRKDKRWLAEQIRDDAEKYSKITGRPFAVPACGDL
jgi:hypothetical protein